MLSYDQLTATERRLWDAFPGGRRVDLRGAGAAGGEGTAGAERAAGGDRTTSAGRPTGADRTTNSDRPTTADRAADSDRTTHAEGTTDADDPAAGGEHWGAERTVRASVLAALLLGANPPRSGEVAALRLAGARVTGRLDLDGAQVGHALDLEGCYFDEPLSLVGATTRTVRVVHSRLPGIDGRMAHVDGTLDLLRSRLSGRLSLMMARVTGELRLSGARLTGPPSEGGDWALFAGGLVVDGGVFCRWGFVADGGLRLPGATIAGGLFMEGAHLRNPSGPALIADSATLSSLQCTEGFTAEGTVSLRDVKVSGVVSFDGARLLGPATALDCSRARIGDLEFTPAAPPSGPVDLEAADVQLLHTTGTSWPEEVRLQGFVYGAIRSAAGGAGRAGVAENIGWLQREPGYAPQPYEQLAGWYRRIGHDDDARRVLLAKQRRRRATLSPVERAWGYLLDATVGYGYRPWLAALWLIALSAAGTAVFTTGHPSPVQPGQGPPFNALVYTLDLLIPIGDLGQRSAYYWSAGPARWLSYTLIAAGWLLTTALVSGITRSLNRT